MASHCRPPLLAVAAHCKCPLGLELVGFITKRRSLICKRHYRISIRRRTRAAMSAGAPAGYECAPARELAACASRPLAGRCRGVEAPIPTPRGGARRGSTPRRASANPARCPGWAGTGVVRRRRRRRRAPVNIPIRPGFHRRFRIQTRQSLATCTSQSWRWRRAGGVQVPSAPPHCGGPFSTSSMHASAPAGQSGPGSGPATAGVPPPSTESQAGGPTKAVR